jgi:hypothetical protein
VAKRAFRLASSAFRFFEPDVFEVAGLIEETTFVVGSSTFAFVTHLRYFAEGELFWLFWLPSNHAPARLSSL